MLIHQRICIVLCFVFLSFGASSESSKETIQTNNTNFVVLVYHHVSSETPPSTSISPEKFEEHLTYLAQHHNVVSLEDALTALKANSPLPEKSVVITFDDGYANIYDNGLPLLKRFNFPYTIFINPEEIGKRANQLSWQQIKEMAPLGTFANHTIGHLHLLEIQQNENEEEWLMRVIANIVDSEDLIEEKIGYSKKWLAYPYGEYNNALKDKLLEMNYIGFGQQSGAVASYSDIGALPRFPAAGIYANLRTLKVKLNSLAMPVKSLEPQDTVVLPNQMIDTVTLNLYETPDMRITQMNCFYNGESIPNTIEGWSANIQLNLLLSPGRHRINCTAPSNSQKGRFYWYSIPFFVPTEEGTYLE